MFQSKIIFVILRETLTTLYAQMHELINLKIKAGISIISLTTSWFIAQATIIESVFEKSFSLGLLLVAVVVIWKAFSKKDESETRLLREQIDILQKINEHQAKTITHLQEKK